jgi:DNA (cytosine-5)-methyltransferase 1
VAEWTYYNDNDEFCATWLSKLVLAGHLPAGDIEWCDLQRTRANLDEYRACHFFAGIGGWPLALELAGWPNNEIVWTGSCPCQPFSQAGMNQTHRRPPTSNDLWRAS